jgi:Amt family ammonium transporter
MLEDAVECGEPFRLAILDMQMPGMDGVQLAESIPDHPDLRDTALILLTSLIIDEKTRERIKAARFAATITKPVKQSHLLDAILKAVLGKDATVFDRLQRQSSDSDTPDFLADRQHFRILLVEDNDINQQVATNILELAGYTHDVAANGLQAVDAVKQNEYALILMDCQMPEMDGFEATRVIRQLEESGEVPNPSAGRIPIVALTANALKGDRERCLAVGMDDYVSKPLNPNRLIAVINHQIEERAQRPVLTQESNGDPDLSSSAPADSSTPADTPAPAPPLDVQALAQRCSWNLDLAERLVGQFLKQLDETVQEIQRSIADEDAEDVARVAHRLKGTAANLSAKALAGAAARLEQAGRDRALQDAADSLDQLRKEVERCVTFAPEMLKSLQDVKPQSQDG